MAGITVGGIVQPAICTGDRCTGYDVVDIGSGRSVRLATDDADACSVSVGRFGFLPEGLEFGRASLTAAMRCDPRLLIIDEAGPLELSGGGWAAELDAACRRKAITLLTVRRRLLERALNRWAREGKAGVEQSGFLCGDLDDGAERIIEAILSQVRGSA